MAQFVEHLLASREPWIQNPELRKWRQEGLDVQGRPQLYSYIAWSARYLASFKKKPCARVSLLNNHTHMRERERACVFIESFLRMKLLILLNVFKDMAVPQ